MLQCPYISKTLSLPPPQNKNDWVHSVIFEPQPKMQLTRSSYKITSFLDFQPFLQGFQSVDKYIQDLMADINNPTYFQKLITPFHDVQVTPLSTDDTITTLNLLYYYLDDIFVLSILGTCQGMSTKVGD